jgi:hypothetical protein
MTNPQGTKADPKRPSSRPTRQPVSAAEMKRQVQPAINAADRAATKPRPAQKISGKQDWRRG